MGRPAEPALRRGDSWSSAGRGSSFVQLFCAIPPEVNNGSLSCIQMSHMLSVVACDILRDCPRHPPTGAEPKACRHTADLPRGVKECIYFDGTP